MPRSVRSAHKAESTRALGSAARNVRRIAALTEGAATVLLEMDRSGVVLFVSPNVESVFGYPAAALIGRSHFDLVPGVWREKIAAIAEAPSDAGATFTETTPYLRPDGTEGAFEATISSYRDGNETRLVIVAREVTKRVESELSLRESEARYREVSDIASDYCFLVRVDPDFTMTREWMTGAFSRITGYHPDEMPITRWSRLVHPDDHDDRARFFADAVQAGGGVHEFRIRTKSGKTRWIREHCSIYVDDGALRWYGSCRDITDRKHAEEAQRISEQRYRAIAENSRDVIVEFGSDSQVFYIAPNVEELIGYGPDDVWKIADPNSLHHDDRSVVIERLTKVLRTGGSERITFRARHRDGSWRWLDTTATAFEAAEGDIRAVAIARDITERLQADHERRRLASIVENSSEFVAMFSFEGELLFLNEAGRKLVGLERNRDWIDKTIFDFVGPEDARALRQRIFPEVLRNGQWIGDNGLRHLGSGKLIPTLANLFLVSPLEPGCERAIAIVARDITARKSAEEALRVSEERYRTLVENAYVLVAEIDEDRRFVFVSQHYRALLGYEVAELLGRPVDELIHPEDHFVPVEERADGSGAGVVRIFDTEKAPSHRLRHRDGSWRWLESHSRRIETRDGEVLTVITSRDTTARRQAEDELRESREMLLQSQKMEAIGRLAGGVAHDFNNLLTAITGNCDLLLEEIGPAHPLRAEAQEIMRASERASTLTRQLLAFSRRQALQPKILDLNAAVREIDRLLRRLIGEDVELITTLQPDLPRIQVDPGQLEQLVMNLAVNARDAMPQGGPLHIETSSVVVPTGGDRAHPGVPAGEYVALSVRDAGIGMDEETLSRVFEPFYTTKEAGKGTGLGLSTVYGVVQQSKGHVRADSEPDVGSTFTVYLPRVEEPPSIPDSRAEHSELRGGESVLLVEDAAPVRRLVRRFLEKHGYTVYDASSAVEALLISRRLESTIDLLITDVVLPKMDGRELASRLESLRPGIRVIYMSGFSDEALSDHGIISTDAVLVQKPFTPAVLLRKVRAVLSDAPDEAEDA